MEGQGEFPSVQQYNLGMGKVGKGVRGRNEGYGKWLELADLPTLHLHSYRHICNKVHLTQSSGVYTILKAYLVFYSHK